MLLDDSEKFRRGPVRIDDINMRGRRVELPKDEAAGLPLRRRKDTSVDSLWSLRNDLGRRIATGGGAEYGKPGHQQGSRDSRMGPVNQQDAPGGP